MTSERDTIVAYIEARAAQHLERAEGNSKNASYHRGTATLFRALAQDIRSELDRDA